MLESMGHKVTSVSSGSECIETLTKQSANSTNLLFLDLFLNDMSGLDVIKAISKSLDSDIPQIIVVSGNSREEAEEIDPSVKIEFYLAKPFTSQALKEVLDQVNKG